MTLAPSVMTYRAMLIAAFSTAIIAHAQISQAQTTSEKDAYEIARDAYIYAYPLVLMDATRQQLTNFVVPPGTPGQGPQRPQASGRLQAHPSERLG